MYSQYFQYKSDKEIDWRIRSLEIYGKCWTIAGIEKNPQENKNFSKC